MTEAHRTEEERLTRLRTLATSSIVGADLKWLLGEYDRLRKWVDDLQSCMYINCVYCGHQYGPRETTPVSMSDALKAHISQCPQHPMSELRVALQDIKEMTNADNPESYRCDDREGCLDSVFARASQALEKTS